MRDSCHIFFFKLAFKVDSCIKNPKIEIFKKLLWTLVIVWKYVFEEIYMIHSKLKSDPNMMRYQRQLCQISFFQRNIWYFKFRNDLKINCRPCIPLIFLIQPYNTFRTYFWYQFIIYILYIICLNGKMATRGEGKKMWHHSNRPWQLYDLTVNSF